LEFLCELMRERVVILQFSGMLANLTDCFGCLLLHFWSSGKDIPGNTHPTVVKVMQGVFKGMGIIASDEIYVGRVTDPGPPAVTSPQTQRVDGMV